MCCFVVHVHSSIVIGGSEQGDVCLGYGGYYGYVQVYLSGNWVHVADTDSTWTRQNSKVVCRQLGFRQRG